MDAGAAVYGYDGEGRRMKKTVGSETTYNFYGPGGILCEFTTANTGATAAATTDKITYRTSDKLGSAVLALNATGIVIENNRTVPYGEAWLPETASMNDKKFTTYQRDSESGLDYAMNRYDNGPTGRFMSPDMGPIIVGRPASLNRYIYTWNDPINLIDPDGLIPDDPLWWLDGVEYARRFPSGGFIIAEPSGTPAIRGVTSDLIAMLGSAVLDWAFTGRGRSANISLDASVLVGLAGSGYVAVAVAGPAIVVCGPVCFTIVVTVTGVYIAATNPAVQKALYDAVEWLKKSRARGHADPIVAARVTTSPDPDGNCPDIPGFKWQAENESTPGVRQWHWIRYDVHVNAQGKCEYNPSRHEGFTDPGPGYILIPGIY